MLPTKDDVYSFINACQRKAVYSVVSEVDECCAELIEKTPIIKETYQKFKEIEDFLNTLPKPEGYDAYKLNHHSNWKEPAPYKKYFGYTSHSEYQLLIRYVITHPEYFQKEHLDKLTELLQKISKVQDTYNGLSYTIKKMRKVDAMISYLQDLGYDTTSLCGFEVKALDKSLLFVCKDNKPDVKS